MLPGIEPDTSFLLLNFRNRPNFQFVDLYKLKQSNIRVVIYTKHLWDENIKRREIDQKGSTESYV